MTTEPMRQILDRQAAEKNAQRFVAPVQPLLQEAINYSTGALVRCMASAPRDGTPNVSATHFVLFRQIIDLADAIEGMLSHGCVTPTKPLLRSMFEAMLGLEYQVESTATEVRRTLSWVHEDIRQRRRASMRIRDGEHRFVPNLPSEALDETLQHIEDMTSVLQEPHMQEVVEEYRTCKKQQRRSPRWYSLFDGPRSFRELAGRFQLEDMYETKYREWSALLHAQGGLHKVFRLAGDEQITMRGLRHPDDLYFIVNLTVTFLVMSMMLLTNRYREGEAPEREVWYAAKIKPELDALGDKKIPVDNIIVDVW